MTANLPTISDLPFYLALLEAHPFATLVLLVAGWIFVQGLKAWRSSGTTTSDKG